MNKEFIPYNEALALKELGFNEQCIAAYRDSEWIGNDGPNSRYFHAQLFKNSQFDADQKEYCSAPLWQQAFRWFREKYKLHAMIDDDGTETTHYYSWRVRYSYGQVKSAGDSKTYEEAEFACLKKLIEIIKTK